MMFLYIKTVVYSALLSLSVAGAALAQDFTALARIDAGQSVVRDLHRGIEVDLYLSQVVPYRVFTLDDPRRLVLDFREVDWRGASRDGMLKASGVSDLRFGVLRPGWSRMVVDLNDALRVDSAGMEVSDIDGTARLRVVMQSTDPVDFAERSGAPNDPEWAFLMADATQSAPAKDPNGPLVVVIDPGHGGIDPGAQRAGINEADVMLQLAFELAEAVARAGMIPVLTRNDDSFVSLEERMTLARAAGADVLLSLHADALEGEQTSGASFYTLSEAGADRASQRMAERHDRADLIAGLDLSEQDDTIATVLMDLARLETRPQTARLASALVSGFENNQSPLHSRPRREAVLAVLNAADFPSVLIEVGFLSSDEDRARLLSPQGREKIVNGIVAGLFTWAAQEDSLAPLVRQ
ncbi:N-acetylmuramoyl-L-alanine amidase [Aestuariibius sp. HNIBRBA575]|uniref:N-acetylmuramoyl-L-alanine amidase n=1 Tax=Aestuariibius sp. HNIBRBA575 TaxID=3233343 RepID=UPI0034A0D47F